MSVPHLESTIKLSNKNFLLNIPINLLKFKMKNQTQTTETMEIHICPFIQHYHRVTDTKGCSSLMSVPGCIFLFVVCLFVYFLSVQGKNVSISPSLKHSTVPGARGVLLHHKERENGRITEREVGMDRAGPLSLFFSIPLSLSPWCTLADPGKAPEQWAPLQHSTALIGGSMARPVIRTSTAPFLSYVPVSLGPC